VGSGGTFSQCAPKRIVAYVTHTNLPLGTTLLGKWYLNGSHDSDNGAIQTTLVNGLTYYPYDNPLGLLAGNYAFVLTSNGTTVVQGTVRIQC
jgi:hypothetical protein